MAQLDGSTCTSSHPLIRLLGPRLRHWTTMIGSNPSLGLQWEQPGRFY